MKYRTMRQCAQTWTHKVSAKWVEPFSSVLTSCLPEIRVKTGVCGGGRQVCDWVGAATPGSRTGFEPVARWDPRLLLK